MINTTRNRFFIDEKWQNQIGSARLVIIGCGIGSLTAELAVRSGFRNIVIADGDTVSDTNLNRQNYRACDIGRLKTDALRDRLLSIAPDLNLTVDPKFWSKDDIETNIQRGDIVINAIDFDAPECFLVHDVCKSKKAFEIFPINFGFGSGLLAYSPNHPLHWADKLSKDVPMKMQIVGRFLPVVPPYLREAFVRYQENPPENDPQTGLAGYCSAVLSVHAAILASKNGELAEQYFIDPVGGMV